MNHKNIKLTVLKQLKKTTLEQTLSGRSKNKNCDPADLFRICFFHPFLKAVKESIR